MADPREKKLPKWAREELREARLMSVLRFPDQPEPKPDFVIDASGYGVGTPSLIAAAGSTLFQAKVSTYSTTRIRTAVIDRNGYEETGSGYGRRGEGRYYHTQEDAVLALRWEICRKAARDLLAAVEGEP